MRRFEDLQHDLLHGDFAQGATLAALPNEPAVQIWVAQALRQVQGKAYSVDREAHRAGEKEPDIVIRAKASDANVAIEIKVIDELSVTALEAALTTQLCGRYLRAKNGRHGILLLVHQKPRTKGWQHPVTGEWLELDGVLDYLRKQVSGIAALDADGPRPVIAVLNVSEVDGALRPRQVQ
jgi:hypothetical protein